MPARTGIKSPLPGPRVKSTLLRAWPAFPRSVIAQLALIGCVSSDELSKVLITAIYPVSSIACITRSVELELGFSLNLQLVVFMLHGEAPRSLVFETRLYYDKFFPTYHSWKKVASF